MDRRRVFLSVAGFILCIAGYFALPLLTRKEDQTKKATFHLVPVLCFHDLDGAGPYSLTRKEFRAAMEMLTAENIRVIPLQTALAAAKANELMTEPSMVITVDDDYKNSVRVAAPILREFSFPATFFVYVADIHTRPQSGFSYDDLIRLRNEGFEIQNHSYSHRVFHHPADGESSSQYSKRIEREIYTSKIELERRIPGLKIYSFAYPMGFYSEELQSKLFANGYELLLTTDGRPINLTKKFNGVFHRITLQRRAGLTPQSVMKKQIEIAKREISSKEISN